MQMDVFLRYFSEIDREVKVRFLKALVFRPFFAETAPAELLKTPEEFGLPLKYLLSLLSGGPNFNKAIKANITTKLQEHFKRQLVDTGSCQWHCAQLFQERNWILWSRYRELVYRPILLFQAVYIRKGWLHSNSAGSRYGWSCLSKTCGVKLAVIVACIWESKRSVCSLARILQEVTGNRQEDQNKWQTFPEMMSGCVSFSPWSQSLTDLFKYFKQELSSMFYI